MRPTTSTTRRTPSRLALLLMLVLLAGACSGATSTETAADTAPPTSAPTTSDPATSDGSATPSTSSAPPPAVDDTCEIGPVPADAGLDPFYTQGCDLDGFWVVAGDGVAPEAIEKAAGYVTAFFDHDPVLAAHLRATDIRLGIVGADQQTTDMPEWSDLDEAFPDVDWDARARGLSATAERPLLGAGEENLLCLDGDRYAGEDILLHEFAHVLDTFGYAQTDDLFTAELGQAFVLSSNEGTWADTYAATNVFEYWAESVQSYFDRNVGATAGELRDLDPGITELIERTIGGVELPPSCYGA